MPSKIMRADLDEALAALEEPLESPVFNAWPLMEPLEFIESCLRRPKARIERLYASGLGRAIYGSELDAVSKVQLFKSVRALGTALSLILDKVERDPRVVSINQITNVFESWRHYIPA